MHANSLRKVIMSGHDIYLLNIGTFRICYMILPSYKYICSYVCTIIASSKICRTSIILNKWYKMLAFINTYSEVNDFCSYVKTYKITNQNMLTM